ncbi:flagellar biosynthesis protein FliQ [Thermoleophilum album]|jgi:flagellar biosynthetic protein FliQ|uniref:flagellar biosynthesis protein FliQ n=1 Tax=Thermoleophilum album TaxID=29539 RepID=UPI00237C98D6|nr:flagellar biosynthesis protein FliQ [Thermoleophilum album]WDT94578.1 flagellar biosynthesis protein FliQ [Thermoleophilum album]
MTTDTAIHLAQQALDVAVRLSLPLLAVALVVGLVIGVFQAATQIQEMTLVMVPKLAAMAIVAVLAGPWMLDQLVGYTAQLYREIPNLVR